MGRRHESAPHAGQSVWRIARVAATDRPRLPSRRVTNPQQSVGRTGAVRSPDRTSPLAGPEGSKEGSKEGSHRCASATGRTHPVRVANCGTRQARARRTGRSPTATAAPVARDAKNRGGVWPAIGCERPLSEITCDSGLRGILVLLAAGYSVPDLEWTAANVPKQAWWRRGDRVRGLGSLSVEVVSRALGERDARPRSLPQTRSVGSDEERRIHRNTLLQNAEAGRYGAEIRRAALSKENLRELADELEQREADGGLHSARLGRVPSIDGLAKAFSSSTPRNQGRSA